MTEMVRAVTGKAPEPEEVAGAPAAPAGTAATAAAGRCAPDTPDLLTARPSSTPPNRPDAPAGQADPHSILAGKADPPQPPTTGGSTAPSDGPGTLTDRPDPRAAAPDPRASWPALPRLEGRHRTGRLLALSAEIPPSMRWLLRAASLLAPVAAWWLLSASHVVSPTFLPSPGAVWSAGMEMLRSGELLHDTAASVRRVVLGFGLAVAISVPLGVAMGAFRAFQAALEPVIGLLRYLPASAFIPLLIIWLGLGEPSKVAILVIGVVFFNTLMTADVVRLVPRELIDVSYTLGATRGKVLRKVVLPHALPGMIDAMRVNAAAAWNFVVIAELVAVTSGLGYRIVRAQRFLQTDRIFAVLVVIGLIGLAIDVALRLLREWVGRWTA